MLSFHLIGFDYRPKIVSRKFKYSWLYALKDYFLVLFCNFLTIYVISRAVETVKAHLTNLDYFSKNTQNMLLGTLKVFFIKSVDNNSITIMWFSFPVISKFHYCSLIYNPCEQFDPFVGFFSDHKEKLPKNQLRCINLEYQNYSFALVIAPCAAEPTSVAYFASAPVV